jgi:ATP-dependent protease HslVU (ClpYQ) ATPase subunit
VSQSAPAVAIRHLSKSYRRGGQVVSVLEDISFSADTKSGDAVVIDGDYVREKVGHLADDADLSRFIL